MGGGEEHVESRVKSGHVVAASVSLVDVVGLVQEEPLRQELHHLGNFDRDEFEGENDDGDDQNDDDFFDRVGHRIVLVEVHNQPNDVDENADEGRQSNGKVDDLR